MEVILVIHLFLALAIIGLVLLQRSEGGGLGIGGGGGMGRLTTAKGAANLLTRATAICAAAFFATSLLLGIMAGHRSHSQSGILDSINETKIEAPASADDSTKEEAQTPATDEAKPDNPPVAPIAD